MKDAFKELHEIGQRQKGGEDHGSNGEIIAGLNGTDLGILKNRGGRPAVIHDYAAV